MPPSNDNLLFDWVPHVDRLKHEAEEASLAGRESPWALAEAECWLDLVEAELEAHRAMRQDRSEVEPALGFRQGPGGFATGQRGLLGFVLQA
ncbi:MAG TPA: hypothetical protein VIN06_05250, partial [Devosia sp.]